MGAKTFNITTLYNTTLVLIKIHTSCILITNAFLILLGAILLSVVVLNNIKQNVIHLMSLLCTLLKIVIVILYLVSL
jgi:hypothetical protein